MKNTEPIKFECIDYFNRPVFKSVKNRNRFGSVDKLFSHGDTEADVLREVTEADLCFFGTSRNCEPMGTSAGNVEIITN